MMKLIKKTIKELFQSWVIPTDIDAKERPLVEVRIDGGKWKSAILLAVIGPKHEPTYIIQDPKYNIECGIVTMYSECRMKKDERNDKMETKMETFKDELEQLINKYSIENILDMPDFILSKMLCDIISAMGPNIKKTLDWHGRDSVCHPCTNDKTSTIMPLDPIVPNDRDAFKRPPVVVRNNNTEEWQKANLIAVVVKNDHPYKCIDDEGNVTSYIQCRMSGWLRLNVNGDIMVSNATMYKPLSGLAKDI